MVNYQFNYYTDLYEKLYWNRLAFSLFVCLLFLVYKSNQNVCFIIRILYATERFMSFGMALSGHTMHHHHNSQFIFSQCPLSITFDSNAWQVRSQNQFRFIYFSSLFVRMLKEILSKATCVRMAVYILVVYLLTVWDWID